MTVRRRAGLPAMCSSRGAGQFFGACVAALLAAVLGGCTSEAPIIVEQVPNEEIGPAPVATPIERTDRMLAAIVPHGETATFFKVTGPEKPVAGLKDRFLQLVTSVTFEDDTPRWKLPEGWTQTEESGERLATITIPGEPPLEASVTALPMRGDDSEFRLANVIRWRRQMGLRPITLDQLHAGGDLNEETRAVSLEDGTKVTLVNIAGTFSGGMRPPFLSGTAPSVSPSPRASDPSAVTYDVPESWQDLGAQGIAAATLLVGEVKTTVTRMPAEANPLLPNVNRWRRQVGLPEIKEEQLDESLETVTLGDGEEAHAVQLAGPNGEGTPQAILGVIAYRGDDAWFVKMIGDSKDVLDQQTSFKRFVASLRLPQGGR